MASSDVAQITNQEKKFTEEYAYVFPDRPKEDRLAILTILRQYPDFVFYSTKVLVLALRIAEDHEALRNLQWANYPREATDNFIPYIIASLPGLVNSKAPLNIDIAHYGLDSKASYQSFIIDLDRMLKNLTRPVYL